MIIASVASTAQGLRHLKVDLAAAGLVRASRDEGSALLLRAHVAAQQAAAGDSWFCQS